MFVDFSLHNSRMSTLSFFSVENEYSSCVTIHQVLGVWCAMVNSRQTTFLFLFLTAFISICWSIGRKNCLFFLLTAFISACCLLAFTLQCVPVRHVCSWAGHTMMAACFQLLQEAPTKIQRSETPYSLQRDCLNMAVCAPYSKSRCVDNHTGGLNYSSIAAHVLID